MSDLQNALKDLQPYLLGIRYVESIPVLEVQFKEGWFLPESKLINKSKIEEGNNQFVLFAQAQGVGLDELLKYLETTIKANIEREKKVELLKVKVAELKQVFTITPLDKLQKLKFVFEEKIDSEDMYEIGIDPPLPEPEIKMETEPEEILPAQPQIPQGINPEQILPVQSLTDDEKEMAAEEERAENYLKIKEAGLLPKLKKVTRVELPPKKKIANMLIGEEEEANCNCSPDSFCDKCMESKGL